MCLIFAFLPNVNIQTHSQHEDFYEFIFSVKVCMALLILPCFHAFFYNSNLTSLYIGYTMA